MMLATLLPLWLMAQPTPTCGGAGKCAVPLRIGGVAPFAGQLLTPELALQLAQGADSCAQRAEADKKRLLAEATIERQRLMDSAKVDTETLRGALMSCSSALDEARLALRQRSPWYLSPALWLPVVAVASAGVVVWASGSGR